jgi:hypothetical protein
MLSQFFLFNRGFYSISADEAGRVLDAFYFFNGTTGLYSIWLPFQKLLYTTSFFIHFDLFWVPRILSVLFSHLTLLSVIFLYYELFDDLTGSLITGLLGSIFFGIVLFSVLPLVEIYFFFFTISSIAFLLRWIRSGNNVYLWISVFLCFINNTTRFEAWIFAAVIWLIIVFKLKKISVTGNKIFIFTLVTLMLAAFPLIWIYLGNNFSGNSSSFITSVAERYKQGDLYTELKNSVIYNFFEINLTSLNIFGLVTILLLYKSGESVKYFINLFAATLLLTSIILFFSKAMPSHNSWRLAVVWSVMLIPFTAHLLYLLYKEKNKLLNYTFFMITGLLIYFFSNLTNDMSEISFMSREEYNIGKMFNSEEMFRNKKIFISHNSWRYTGIAVASQDPDKFILDQVFSDKFSLDAEKITPELIDRLRENGIEYMLLQKNEESRPGLQLIQEYDLWSLYRLPEQAALRERK